MQALRLSEMRANRELNEVKEKNEYFARLLRTSTASVKKLEEQVAELEGKIMKREEEFRRADNDRMRKFFNARYDDIPAAFNNAPQGGASGPLLGRAGTNRRDDDSQFFTGSARGGGPGGDGKGGPQPPGNSSSVTRNAMNILADFNVPVGMGRSDSQVSGSGTQDPKFLESMVKRLKGELSKAVEEIRSKDALINRFKEWQMADKYL
jgi:Coiled-coil region of centrosome protein CE290